MGNGGQLTSPRRLAKVAVTATAAAALTLTATAAAALTLTATAVAALALTAASASAVGTDGTVAGISALYGVACPTATACVSVGIGGADDNIGKSAVITAGTGQAKVWSGGLTDEPLTAVGCAAKAKTCLTVAGDAIATVSVATGAMKVTAVPKPPPDGVIGLGAVACASAKDCYAVGFQGTESPEKAIALHLSAAGKVLGKTTGAGKDIAGIACPATTRCLISDSESAGVKIQLLNSGKFGAAHALPAGTYVEAIACYQASLCYALGGNSQSSPITTDELFPLNPATGAPGSMITLSGINGNGLTCISATTCVVAGFSGEGSTAKPAAVPVTSGTPGPGTNKPGENRHGVACATASLCYAVGLTSTKAIVDKVAS
jgi:hypothetical protein